MLWYVSEGHGFGTVFWLVGHEKDSYLSAQVLSSWSFLRDKCGPLDGCGKAEGRCEVHFIRSALSSPTQRRQQNTPPQLPFRLIFCAPSRWRRHIQSSGVFSPLKTEWCSKESSGLEPQPWPFELSDLEHQFPHLQNGH